MSPMRSTVAALLALLVTVPAAPAVAQPAPALERAVFAGGCFWGMEAVFAQLRGVSDVVSGYAGGSKATAFYELVGTGLTGHAESVEMTFDPRQISYRRLLDVYFTVAHDPTQRNRQGPDEGPQYRSEIFYATPAQQRAAEATIRDLEAHHRFHEPIVTTVAPLVAFYPAESYHQHFAERHPDNPYIVAIDEPKIVALHKQFPDALKRRTAER